MVSTVGAHALAGFLSETLPDELLSPITSLYYAPIVEVAVGFDPVSYTHLPSIEDYFLIISQES